MDTKKENLRNLIIQLSKKTEKARNEYNKIYDRMTCCSILESAIFIILTVIVGICIGTAVVNTCSLLILTAVLSSIAFILGMIDLCIPKYTLDETIEIKERYFELYDGWCNAEKLYYTLYREEIE